MERLTIMVLTYLRKTEKLNETGMSAALDAVKKGNSINSAAMKFGVSRGALRCRLKSKTPENPHAYKHIFNAEQEASLKRYLLRSVAMYHDLSYPAVRKLAYEFSVTLTKKKLIKSVPKSWKKSKCATTDWLNGFMLRHPDLSLRKPMATSLGRATAFNRHNVKKFFGKLKDVIQRFKIQLQNIWNVDESALTTVQKPVPVVAPRGARSVGGISSGERGTLVTLTLACSARGMVAPPFYVFPRAKFQEHFLSGLDADGAANPSSWMKSEQFFKFLNHFVKYAHPTKKVPVLLLLDNHESHLSISNLDFCKENGIVVLSFPPHTTNKLQPLDRSVFGPIKRYFHAACDTWMRLPQNARKTITIYDIPRIAAKPIESGASVSNIKSGFAVSGIWPLNENVFTDIDFLPSDITDRENTVNRASTSADSDTEQERMSAVSDVNETVDLDKTLEEIHPYPKAAPRKQTKRGRKRKSAILTDSQEMTP
ncbi:uncharacterized protein LOC122497779 isoform X2 [Leptopilina heterotoma]|uniref:uncharacterized protein LOC122497779 isoform X2 n=1 Tax=Leptopilina heterotoma TaxID=63436 RepID=UPI001CA89635|nr:uncharacterized protein LOC122497779 isoform X2 [Leptopilina heterotoma]